MTEYGLTRDRVLAVVAELSDGTQQVSSGYLVDAGLVLTAEHATRNKDASSIAHLSSLVVVQVATGAEARITRPPLADRGLDVALLSVSASGGWPQQVSPLEVWGVDRSRPGVLGDCSVIGLPRFAYDLTAGLYGTAELHGDINQTDGAETGHLLMRDPRLHGTRDPETGQSGWNGLSGALVFYRGRALGMVVEHHPHQGDNSLRLIGFDRMTANTAIRESLKLPERLTVARRGPVTLTRRALVVGLTSIAVGGVAFRGAALVRRPPRPRWVASTGGPVTSSPAVAGDTVFIGSNDGSLYALDVGTGARRWSYGTEGPVTSSPRVADGVVYVGSNDRRLHALDAGDGRGLWTFETGGVIHSSPDVQGSTVFVGSRDNRLWAVRRDNGQEVWSFEGQSHAGEVIGFNSSPKYFEGAVFIGCRDTNIYAVRADDGVQLWRRTTGSTVDSSAAISGGKLCIGSDDRQLWALDRTSGKPVWRFSAEAGIVSTPTFNDEAVFVGSGDGNLYAVDASTGRLRWAFSTGGAIRSSPTVSGGNVYVGSADFSLYAVDEKSGDLGWSFPTGAPIDDSSPIVYRGMAIVGSLDGNVYAVDAERGARPSA